MRRLLPLWILFFAGLLLLAELVLRMPAVQAALPKPEPTLWHAEMIEYKLEYLKKFAASHDLDVLFVGNSTTQAGVDPTVFDTERNLSAGAGSFNASIEGLPPAGLLTFLKIYLRYVQPQHVVIGLSAQDLNSNSPWAKDVTDRVKASPLAMAEAREGWLGQVLAFALDHSVLFRYRNLLHQFVVRGGQLAPASNVYFDDRGFDPIDRSLASFSASEALQLQNRAGVLNYDAGGLQLQSLKQTIQLLQEQGIDVVLVNMPLADGYYRNFDKPEDYDRYLAALHQVAEQFDVPVLDMESLPAELAFGDAEFADFNHLNATGAQRLTALIADYFAAGAEQHVANTTRP
ncbi:MAG: SGNH/GDSL hydrolase family protein [Anaerolineales bacterium]|nr:SGNH/GDSL hydrolase family protein [Anaerolineales bacterium]